VTKKVKKKIVRALATGSRLGPRINFALPTFEVA